MKRKVVILAALMAGLYQAIPVYASEAMLLSNVESGIMPLYENINQVLVDISETSDGVECITLVSLAKSGNIEITMRLQRYVNGSWDTIETWSGTKNAKMYNFVKEKALSNTEDLRVKSTITVTVDGVSETVTKTDAL